MADEKDVKGEVDKDLINFLSDFETVEDDNKDDVKDPVDPPTDDKKDEPPKDTNPNDDLPPKDDNDEDELTTVKKQNELLLQRLDKLENVPIPKDDKSVDDKKVITKDDIDFLEGMTDEEYDAMFEDRKKFNTLLLKVFKKGQETKTFDVSENVLKNIPKLVVEYQKRHNTTQEIVADFYKNNPDLVKVKRTVAAITNEVASEMPDKSIKECFEEVAKRTRTLLGMKSPSGKKEQLPPAGDPNLPDKTKQKKGTNSKAAELKGVAKEINDLIM